MRKQIFNNRETTELMQRYVRHPKSRKLQAEIIDRVIPLVNAAITRKRLFHLRDDLQQEVLLKVLQALPKFDKKRGSAFAFLWSTICNSIITQSKKLSKGALSIEEEEIRREAEIAVPSKFQSPEHSQVVGEISKALEETFRSNGIRKFFKNKDRRAITHIQQSIASGDFFVNRSDIFRKLRRLGFKKKDSQFLVDCVLVTLRAKLYPRRELLYALAHQQTGSNLSEKFNSGI